MAEAFKIRLDVETKRRWQAAASEEGVSLAEWVRRRCESGLPPKEIRVVTDVWLPGTFEVLPLAPTVHVDGSPPIDPEEVAASTIVCVSPSVGEFVPIPEEPTVLDEIIPKPKPKAFNFSRCIQPQLLCQFRNMPLCGPCKELNQ